MNINFGGPKIMFQVDIVFTIAMDADDFIKLIDFSLLRVMSTLGDISQIGDKF